MSIVITFALLSLVLVFTFCYWEIRKVREDCRELLDRTTAVIDLTDLYIHPDKKETVNETPRR